MADNFWGGAAAAAAASSSLLLSSLCLAARRQISSFSPRSLARSFARSFVWGSRKRSIRPSPNSRVGRARGGVRQWDNIIHKKAARSGVSLTTDCCSAAVKIA